MGHLSPRRARALAFALPVIFLAASASAQTREFAWSDNAVSLRGQMGTTVRLHCAPGGTPSTVWGTDVYTDDSSVCGAAVHAGLFDRTNGGDAVLRILPGLPTYRGSARNGVTSANYATYPGSFSFVGINPPLAVTPITPSTAPPPGWSDNATRHRGRNGATVEVRCAAGGTPGAVWGSGPYTDDSSICGAAVHTGTITVARGGRVRIRIGPALTSSRGSARNGVTSLDYGAYPGSYTVLRR